MAAQNNNTYTLHPPTKSMDSDSEYKFMYELWNRSGGYKQSTTNLNGLTASVQELNTLTGINTGNTVQQQIDSQDNTSSLGTRAYQNSSSVAITGGSADSITIANSIISASTIVSGSSMTGGSITSTLFNTGTITNSTIYDGLIYDCSVTFPTGDAPTTIAPSGKIYQSPTAVSNVDATENDLISYSMGANVLDTNGYFLEVTVSGTVASNANNKRIKMYFGSTVVLDTTAVAANSGSWDIKTTVLRTSGSAEKVSCSIISDNGLIVDSSTYTSVSEDTTSPIIIKCTGQGVAAGDITQEFLIIKLFN